MNCCNLGKLDALRFHLQLASLDIDLNIRMYIEIYVQVVQGTKALTLWAPGTLTYHFFFVIGSLY